MKVHERFGANTFVEIMFEKRELSISFFSFCSRALVSPDFSLF